MDGLIVIFAAVGFGASFGALAVVYSVIHSTLAAPPSSGAGVSSHLKVVAVRLVFFGFAITSIIVARPLRIVADDGVLAPAIALAALFIVLISGMKYVAPKFVRIRLTTEK